MKDDIIMGQVEVIYQNVSSEGDVTYRFSNPDPATHDLGQILRLHKIMWTPYIADYTDPNENRVLRHWTTFIAFKRGGVYIQWPYSNGQIAHVFLTDSVPFVEFSKPVEIDSFTLGTQFLAEHEKVTPAGALAFSDMTVKVNFWVENPANVRK